MAPARSRRRSYYYSIYGADVNGKLDFPIGENSLDTSLSGQLMLSPESLPVGRWAKEHYDPRSAMMALFMAHAVINNNTTVRSVSVPASCPLSLLLASSPLSFTDRCRLYNHVDTCSSYSQTLQATRSPRSSTREFTVCNCLVLGIERYS